MINRKHFFSQGFTILEMMISLTLMMSLLMVSMRVYEFGVDSWNRADEILSESDTDAVTFSFMRKTLDNLVAENWTPKQEEKEKGKLSSARKRSNIKIFDGNNDAVRFAAPLPVHHGKDVGIYLFEFSVRTLPGDASSSLVVIYYPLDWTGLENTLAQEPQMEQLMSNVDSINFEYFGNKDIEKSPRSPPKWQQDWKEHFYLPLAIKISITRSEPLDEERFSANDYSDIVMKLGKRYVR